MKRVIEVEAGGTRLVLRNRTVRTDTTRTFYARALLSEFPGMADDPILMEDAAKFTTILSQIEQVVGRLPIPAPTAEPKIIRESFEQYLEADPTLWSMAWRALDTVEESANPPEMVVEMPTDPNASGRGGTGKKASGTTK